jgi:predicted lipid-binding transport protein (Tim44 family)
MSNIPGDIIFFVVIAVVLLVQFNSILGKGETDDGSKVISKKDLNKKVVAEIVKLQTQQLPKDANVLEIKKDVYNKAIKVNKGVQEGIDEISAQDKSFNLEEFLKGSITAFGLIVLSYAKGNLAVLKNMLDDELFSVFKSDIKSRDKEENIDTRIEKMNKINITKAKLQGAMIYITVKFVSEQTTAIRDKDGQVLKGDPEQSREITDIWTFAKDIRSGNPNWTLVSSES